MTEFFYMLRKLLKSVIMSKISKKYQENTWKSNFGSKYLSRHPSKKWVENNFNFFKKCFSRINIKKIKTIIEFGSSVGLNLIALNKLNKFKNMTAVEINQTAYDKLKKLNYVNPVNESVLDYSIKKKFDLVLTKGFLIHVNPDKLRICYQKIYDSCKKKGYILICEYYNPTPVMINYRGKKNLLFKRDFVGDIFNIFSNIKLIDYGFVYRKDKHPQDDITWFLLKKR